MVHKFWQKLIKKLSVKVSSSTLFCVDTIQIEAKRNTSTQRPSSSWAVFVFSQHNRAAQSLFMDPVQMALRQTLSNEMAIVHTEPEL